jgi:Ankyrin repeats (3 copies)
VTVRTESIRARRAVLAACAFAACVGHLDPRENGAYGGEPERQLVEATVASDARRVKQLLASGADPNKMAPHEGHHQSAWKLALHQVRAGRRDQLEIVEAMLQAHAYPEVAWGEGPSRSSSAYTVHRSTPIFEATSHDVPDLVRALLKAGLSRSSRETQTALLLAAENSEDEIVHVLVEAGVDVNTPRAASTPLTAAINAQNGALIIYLEQHGARK